MADNNEQLTIGIHNAQYNAETDTASLSMGNLISNGMKLWGYDGDFVRLENLENHDRPIAENCPEITVDFNKVFSNVGFNKVDISMGGITQGQADAVEKAQCMMVDTEDLKKVASDLQQEQNKGAMSNLNP